MVSQEGDPFQCKMSIYYMEKKSDNREYQVGIHSPNICDPGHNLLTNTARGESN